MSTPNALKIIQVLLGLIEVAKEVGLDVSQLVEAKERADAEGRDLTDEELNQFRDSAQASIDAARDA